MSSIVSSAISTYQSTPLHKQPTQQQSLSKVAEKHADRATISSEAQQLAEKRTTEEIAKQYNLTNMSPNGIRHLAQQLHESGDISAIQMGSMVLPLSVQERLGYVQEKINYLENQRSYNEFISHSGSEIEKELQADLLSKLELLHSQRKL